MIRPLAAMLALALLTNSAQAADTVIRVGIIGLDTSHVVAFTRLLNNPQASGPLVGIRVVAAYPRGSADIASSVSRVPGYTADVQKLGVEIVDSIDVLLTKVDAVLLESNDGRPHLEQATPVINAGKPLFIDKPIAGSLTDAVEIFRLAEQHKVPCFSSSSLRFYPGVQAMRNNPEVGAVKECTTSGPSPFEPTHPDLFWYGIHGVETLFTIMGAGCQSVSRETSGDLEIVRGVWKDGRKGEFRGAAREGKSSYAAHVVGEKSTADAKMGGGYQPLLEEICKFFRTGKPPVTSAETIEIYAFMEAADESKRQGGAVVTLESVLAKAKK